MSDLHVVTGAFGFTGAAIAERLLASGATVRTLTNRSDRPNPFHGRLEVAPLAFDDPDQLLKSLEGATTLYNTYWVRFDRGSVTFDLAVEHTKRLVKAAEQAGVRRIVHISIANAARESPLPYFRGKALAEQAVVQSGLSYAIIRPTFIFGATGLFLNNIAWLLRRFPFFAIPGNGDYRLQPVSVEDVALMAVTAATGDCNVVTDAAGPDIYAFDELVRLIARNVGSKARLVHLHPELALLLSRLIGYVVGDTLITREEVQGLMASLLVSTHEPTGQTRLDDWLETNAATLGTRYVSEIQRHYR